MAFHHFVHRIQPTPRSTSQDQEQAESGSVRLTIDDVGVL